jgi:hypothetical protein
MNNQSSRLFYTESVHPDKDKENDSSLEDNPSIRMKLNCSDIVATWGVKITFLRQKDKNVYLFLHASMHGK